MSKSTRRRVTALRRPKKAAPKKVVVKKARRASNPDGTIELNLVDGTRQPATGVQALVRLFNGRQQLIHQGTHRASTIQFTGLHVADNLDDRFSVSVAVNGCRTIGFTPVVIRAGGVTRVDLMLIPNAHAFDFTNASWADLTATDPDLILFLSAGAGSGTAAEARYNALMTGDPSSLAALLNIWTAMRSIHLGGTATPLTFLKALDWTSIPPAPDRFFCYADPDLVNEVVQAAGQGLFAQEPNPQVFHQGATRSYKQIQFGEANVQLTFHENDTQVIDGVSCVLVEPDIDYYKDLLAHGLLEIVPGRMSDPVQVYLLRWIAGQQAGIAAFDPPYTIVSA